MKRTIRLRENELRRMIAESVRRVLKEQKEYDWDEFEDDPELIKSLDNEDSWNEKEDADAKAKASTQIWDIDGAPEGWIEDFPQYNTNQGAGYDSGYESMYGDRDVNDEYFNDSDYPFRKDRWEEMWHPEDRQHLLNKFYDENSHLNEGRIRSIVNETINRIIKR